MTKSWRFACKRIFICFSLITGMLPVQAQIVQQDYDALVALYNSTNGSSWNNSTGWLGPNDATVANWFGITVENDRVVQISLRDNNLTGTLPPEIGDLTAIRFLLLGPDQPPFSNQIGGSIPAEIGNLTNLIRLNLQFNALTGSLPTTLGNLVNLVRLELSANQLSGTLPSLLGNLTELQHLALGINQLSGNLPAELGQLSKLTWLAVANNQLTGSIPAALGDLALLETLQLQLNQFSGSIPEALSNLTALKQFYFFNNNLSGGVPSWLGNLTNLESLQGQNNPFGGTLPATLGSLGNLKTLTLSNCQVTGAVPVALANLSNLTTLWLQGNFITALPNLSGISGLTGLSNFQVQNNNLTFESIEPHVAQNPTYSPQRQIPGIADFNVDEGESFSLSYSVGGSANMYQWYKNNAAIPEATEATYHVPSAAISDGGTYFLEITNSIATGLALQTGNTVISVNDNSAPQWIKVDVGSTDGLFDVQFADERAGFTGGNSGEFIRTTDGGQTWERLTDAIGFEKSIRDIHFIDRHRGWVVGAQGLLARTENGGLNWTLTSFPGVTINTVWFTSALNGWLGYGNGNVFRTVNGGVTWSQQPTGTSGIIDEIQFVNDQVGYIASPGSGSGPLLLKTIDSGQSWQLVNTNNGGNALYFFDESKGFVGSLNGFLYSTTNGGQTFVSEGRPSNSTIHALDFASDNIGWFSGLNNTLYHTTNGGATWVRETTGLSLSDQIRRVHSVRTDFAWATSLSEGVLLKYGQMGNVIVEGYESSVQRTVASVGSFDFNDGGATTYTSFNVSQVASPGPVTITLQQESPKDRQLSITPTPQFANMRWSVEATADLPDGYTIIFDLENMPGLPIHDDLSKFVVLRRDVTGSGSFALVSSVVENGKLSATGIGSHEFAIVMVDGPVVSDAEVCSGADAVLTASGAQPGETYNWYAQADDITPIFSGNPLVISSATTNATYYVAISDGVNEGIRVGATVTVIPSPSLTVTSTTDESVCLGTTGSITFQFADVPDGLYSLTYDDGTLGPVTVASGEGTIQVSGGTYNTIRITVLGCSSAPGVQVTIDTSSEIPNEPTVSDAERCGAGSVLFQAMGATGTQQYRWYFAVSDESPVESESQGQFITTLAQTTTYYVSIADGQCESERIPVTGLVYRLPDNPVISNEQACSESAFTLTATGAEPTDQYAWYENSTEVNPIVVNSSGEFTTPVLEASRSYFVSILTEDGCESVRVEVLVEITNFAAPVITTPDGLAFCEGGSIRLQGPDDFFGYEWSDNSKEQNLVADVPGTYSLVVYDENNCVSLPAIVNVVQHPTPDAAVTMSNDRLTTGQAAAYQWYLFDEPIAGATESFLEINLLRYGIYSVRLVSAQGCEIISEPFVYLITDYNELSHLLRLYPNPSHNKLHISLENDQTIKKWIITNTNGQTMFIQHAVEIADLDISDWSAGMYIIQLETQNGIITRKFVKP
jgi:photosystem II stability/assembly factor-like uncharacterized protein/Leucine-rich repeat (LRR) protein